jgi:hypothetical protein
MGVAMVLHLASAWAGAQDGNPPQLTGVVQTDEQAIRLTWASTTNKLYQIQCADALIGNADGSTAWQTLYTQYPSQGTNTYWLDTGNYMQLPAMLHPKLMPMRFYRIVDTGADTASNEPQVSITAPTNGTVVSGELIITVAASTDQPVLTGTKLYVDGQEMQMADSTTNFTDGVTNYGIYTYSINTCEWGNGAHEIFATAKCASDIGGVINGSTILTGHATSAKLPLTFENLVTRISFSAPYFDPAAGQTQHVSAVLAANSDWTLQIMDVNSNIVRIVTGSGTDLSFDWDGNGDGGTDIPPGTYYYYVTAQTNGGSSMNLTGYAGLVSSSQAVIEELPQLWALAPDSPYGPIPLAIFPPGAALNDFTIIDGTQSEVRALTKSVMSLNKPIAAAKSTIAMNGTRSGVTSFQENTANSSFSGSTTQTTPPAPQRPPTKPVKGVVGTFGVAYQESLLSRLAFDDRNFTIVKTG